MKTRPEEKKLLPPEAQKFDRDKSGGIDSFELREILREDNDISENEVEAVFNTSDVNEDGTIDFQECKQMVQERQFKYLFGYYLNLYIKHIVPRHRRAVDEVQVDGHYENQYSCWPPPLIMLLITALELTLFIINPNNLTINYLIYDPHNRHQLWRYITYMFVHIGYTHLGTNLLIQLILAIPLEMVHKWRVLPLYLAGVLAGSLANALVDPTVSLAGASGGVYALITAHIGTIIMNWSEMTCPSGQLLFFLVISGIDVCNAIYNRYWLKAEDQIGYIAHLGGAISGLLLGICILKNFAYNTREKYVWWSSCVIYIVLMVIMLTLNIFWTDHFS